MSMPVLTPNKLGEEIRRARAESDRLFSILTPAAIYERPIAQRHRVIFYLGHLDGFDVIQICREGLSIPSAHPEFDSLFQAGIDPDSSNLPTDTPADWPSLQEVQNYIRDCRRAVDENQERAPEDIVAMALEHRQMHLETLAYMFQNFPYEWKQADADSQGVTEPARFDNEFVEVASGDAVLGKKEDGSFGWDNEYGEMIVSVPAFRMQRFPVTNSDYLEFVREGAPKPHFWVQHGDRYHLRGMFREHPLPPNWPVYVTQLEAEAYAKWKGMALPSEEQFHRAAYGTRDGRQLSFPWGDAPPTRNRGNFDFHRWDPEPVYACPEGASDWGIRQLVGNGWEWTRSQFAPFPGFMARDSYPGYSANFFDGDHFVLKGGSSRTAAGLLRRSFRNWFRRDYPYMYAKFRCVEN
ncbi:MAG: SUMF1/EgtB/PvdO family nonheme iron enzyme [Acidobacteriaceae bacterium]|nr:SUMF1/EgtB/PvdO family nonheme iron enzyme [Acidobacteriaceae bacterium]